MDPAAVYAATKEGATPDSVSQEGAKDSRVIEEGHIGCFVCGSCDRFDATRQVRVWTAIRARAIRCRVSRQVR